MNFDKLISPSLTKCGVYSALVAGCFYLGTINAEKYNLIADKIQEAKQSNTSLQRVLDMEYHLDCSRVNDSINDELRAEMSRLLENPETKKGYNLIQEARWGSEIKKHSAYVLGGGLSGALGLLTIANTVWDRISRKRLIRVSK